MKNAPTPSQTFLVRSIDAATPDPSGKALAYVARLTLGQPQAPK